MHKIREDRLTGKNLIPVSTGCVQSGVLSDNGVRMLRLTAKGFKLRYCNIRFPLGVLSQ